MYIFIAIISCGYLFLILIIQILNTIFDCEFNYYWQYSQEPFAKNSRIKGLSLFKNLKYLSIFNILELHTKGKIAGSATIKQIKYKYILYTKEYLKLLKIKNNSK